MNKNKWSTWFGPIPVFCWLPTYSYFDGGCYEKKAILWLGFIIEFSREKADFKLYKKLTKEEAAKYLEGDGYYD